MFFIWSISFASPNSFSMASRKLSGVGRERIRETSMLGLPVPAKQKSIKPMTSSLSFKRTLPRLRSPWTSFGCSVLEIYLWSSGR